jgi:hypothetical protein
MLSARTSRLRFAMSLSRRLDHDAARLLARTSRLQLVKSHEPDFGLWMVDHHKTLVVEGEPILRVDFREQSAATTALRQFSNCCLQLTGRATGHDVAHSVHDVEVAATNNVTPSDEPMGVTLSLCLMLLRLSACVSCRSTRLRGRGLTCRAWRACESRAPR